MYIIADTSQFNTCNTICMHKQYSKPLYKGQSILQTMWSFIQGSDMGSHLSPTAIYPWPEGGPLETGSCNNYRYI